MSPATKQSAPPRLVADESSHVAAWIVLPFAIFFGIIVLFVVCFGLLSRRAPVSEQAAERPLRDDGVRDELLESGLRDVSIADLPDGLRKTLLANRAIEDYVKANDDVLFRVFSLGAKVKLVAFRKDSKEVGYAMLQENVINIGVIGEIGFKREKSGGRMRFKRADAKGVWRYFEYPPR